MTGTSAVSNQQNTLPPTTKQLIFARSLAMKSNTPLPWEVQQERDALSRWIDQQKRLLVYSGHDQQATSKQVAFAERIAAIKRTSVPQECFKDRQSMSRWIDCHR